MSADLSTRAPSAVDKSALRDAATVILWRIGQQGPEVLMGTRGAGAAFMPNKVVFPGGAVDLTDDDVAPIALPPAPCRARLAVAPRAGGTATPAALVGAAIREVWEETGLILGQPGQMTAVPTGWASFAATGHRPDATGFRYVFRAVTPPGRPRRFDARFFLVPAAQVSGSQDDFSAASEELSHLQWVPLGDVRRFNLPFITRIVLAEIAPLIAAGGHPPSEGVPHVENDDMISSVTRIV